MRRPSLFGPSAKRRKVAEPAVEPAAAPLNISSLLNMEAFDDQTSKKTLTGAMENYNGNEGLAPIHSLPTHETTPKQQLVFQSNEIHDLYETSIFNRDDHEVAPASLLGLEFGAYRVFRCVVTLQGELRFGKEGNAKDPSIPSHPMLANFGSCLAAGNVYVTKIGREYKVCAVINNSGHYQPKIGNMIVMLEALKDANLLASNGVKICIEGEANQTHHFNLNDIEKILEQRLSNASISSAASDPSDEEKSGTSDNYSTGSSNDNSSSFSLNSFSFSFNSD